MACEMILSLAPKPNGQVAVKQGGRSVYLRGIDHTHLAKPKQMKKIRFRDVQAHRAKLITRSPTSVQA